MEQGGGALREAVTAYSYCILDICAAKQQHGVDKTNEHFLNKRSVTTKSPRIQRGWGNCGPALARCCANAAGVGTVSLQRWMVASSDLGSLANIGTRVLHSDGLRMDGLAGRFIVQTHVSRDAHSARSPLTPLTAEYTKRGGRRRYK